ncbi:uncharacterized protein E0L32_011296 [Thyridium curvatum]|uniref:DNA 3'-5' helicase n=1 Tax=Thyridium curvatum TaxID=1093900 RepID=A0A507B9P4_9PEZI|nr:uncharacterized protein E0L32_011296 [Thyridium curvatum]TPX19052.1 hypothetical protein E0L32_011296 [Thyridium curvatum]
MDDFDSDDDELMLQAVQQVESGTGSTENGKRKRDDASATVDANEPKRLRAANGETVQNGHSSKLALARRILTDKFGYPDFRHEQEGAIGQVLDGNNALVIFPTGAGKSLCYQVGDRHCRPFVPDVYEPILSVTDLAQIPGIAFEELDNESGARGAGEHGVTIVVSPLIALMKDQVDALKRRDIPADCLDSTKKWDEVQLIRQGLEKGQIRILYCAPERLNNEGFVESMKDVAGGVRLIAVDEAHCISEWGHSFRPDYLKVARFVQEIKAERVICLTATATPRVAEDICKAFNIKESGVFRTSPYRPNLHLSAEAIELKEEKEAKLLKFLEKHPGSTLVYVTQQKQAEFVAAQLRRKGLDAQSFHAGMKVEEKQKIQDDFMASKIRIVVATIAFGMGIDKADIRNIIHYDLPSTVEEYSQQIGRAGRDGLASHCMLYLCPQDFYVRENFARGDLPSKHSLQGLLSSIFSDEVTSLSIGETFGTKHQDQSREFDIRLSPLSVIYASLELRFDLIRATTPEYKEYKFEATSKYYPIVKNDKSPAGQAIFTGSRKAAKYHHIDVKEVAKAKGLQRNDIVKKLNVFESCGALKLTASGVENRYRILKPLPKTRKEIDVLVDKLHADLEQREKDALRRLEEVTELITGRQCYALALTQHFGMELPDGKETCGHCSFCLTKEAITLPALPSKSVDHAAIERILAATDIRDDPRFLARVAFGIKSPRVGKLKLDKDPVFASLADHNFGSLLREFEAVCNA